MAEGARRPAGHPVTEEAAADNGKLTYLLYSTAQLDRVRRALARKTF